ncbi:MAG: hypothetical protein Q9173_003325 [Seirophora scorigena]
MFNTDMLGLKLRCSAPPAIALIPSHLSLSANTSLALLVRAHRSALLLNMPCSLVSSLAASCASSLARTSGVKSTLDFFRNAHASLVTLSCERGWFRENGDGDDVVVLLLLLLLLPIKVTA